MEREFLTPGLWHTQTKSLSGGNAARRRVLRVVGVGMGLLRHDGVVKDDVVLVLGIRGRARYAQAHVPKRRSHHRVSRVLQGWLLRTLRHEELVGIEHTFFP